MYHIVVSPNYSEGKNILGSVGWVEIDLGAILEFSGCAAYTDE